MYRLHTERNDNPTGILEIKLMEKIQTHIKLLLLLSCCTMLLNMAHAQDINSLKASFEKYGDSHPQEKIFAHTDRSFYMTGEIVWFKLYTVDARTNKPMDMSKVAYVDVLDSVNNTILQAKIALKWGTGSGSLYIPVTVANGNYKLRAYTNWMKNFSPDFYFEKQLMIVNPLQSPAAPIKKTALTYDIQFFPEGGNLVSGLSSTVGFKAIGADGIGVNVSGAVINEQNDTVARFTAAKFGMGRFIFTPVAGHSYKAVARIGGTNLTKQLPIASASGYVMQVTDAGNQLSVKVRASTGSSQTLYLLAHNGSAVSGAQPLVQGAGNEQSVVIDKAKLGDGINHITLFNADRQPLAERLFFKRPALLNLQAVAGQQFGLRKKADVDINAKSADGQPQQANLSLSVYYVDSLNKTDGADIISYLWLTSALKGNIESPEYYFANVNPATDEALDNLLLTQGWTRFKWSDVLSAKPAAFRFLPEYNGHLVSGEVLTPAGAPARNTIVYMGVIGKKVQLYGAHSGADGQLLFNTRDLYSANEIVLQTNHTYDTTTYKINLKNPFSEQYSDTKLKPFYLNSSITAQLENNSLAMQVQNLYRPENMRQFSTAGIDSATFYGSQYRPFMLDQFTRFTTMEEVLREYVTNANVAKVNQHFHIHIITKNGPLPSDEDPLILLDGVPVFNIDKAFTIDPLKIKRLEVVNQRYYNGPIAANGILSYTSYKGDLGGFELDPKAIVLDYEGLQLQREFYSPAYETADQQKSRLPDFRNLLYWAPDVNTGPDGKARATFYTSDKPGKYIGVVQGLTGNGLVGSRYFMFDVVR